MMREKSGLVADIGGTNARLGIGVGLGRPVEAVRSYVCDDYRDFHTLVEAYISEIERPMPTHACLAIAGPVSGNCATSTNGPWGIDGGSFGAQAGPASVELVNDFTALAWALPWLEGDELLALDTNEPPKGGVRVVVGPGTGLGVSALIEAGGRRTALASEGGHIGFAPVGELEVELLCWFQKLHSRVSVERLLSGEGLVHLHKALGEIEGETIDLMKAPQIVEQGLADPGSQCAQTLHQFLALLGSFAGDLALATGADSVYIGGGIVPRMSSILPQSPFRKRFVAKGRLADHIAKTPVFLITADQPALKGASARLFDETIYG